MREQDIRPADILATYLDLSRRDAETYFPDPGTLPLGDCPGCGASHEKSNRLYEKFGFPIVECSDCTTMYVNPRPAADQLDAFYRDSPSTEYWANTFFPSVAEARRELIFAPRARDVLAMTVAAIGTPHTVMDIGAGYGLFLTELRKLLPGADLRAVEPGKSLADRCRAKGLLTFEGFAEDAVNDAGWNGMADLVVSFEVIEHLPDPLSFVSTMRDLARPGGLVFLSGLCGDGFDIRTLGARSNAVSPPHHLTFLSQKGVRALLARAGLECLSFQTPGKLDVDIVRGALEADDTVVTNPKIRDLVQGVDTNAKSAFQKNLVAECRSSHMWILARRPDGCET
jgi:SAM-dependent methyltransferase